MKNEGILKKIINKLFIPIVEIVILLTILTLLFNFKNINKLDNSYFTVAIGFDKSKLDPNRITVSFQVIKPNAINKYTQDINTSYVISIDETTFEGAVSRAYNYIEGNPDFSHISAVVFSEELSKEGIDKYIKSIVTDSSYNSDMTVIVSRGLAKDYLNSISEIKDLDPVAYYSKFNDLYKQTNSPKSTTLMDFLVNIYDSTTDPTAIYADILDDKFKNAIKEEQKNVSIYDDSISIYDNTVSIYDSNVSIYGTKGPDISLSHPEILGTAVFKNDKLVGHLNLEETAYHLMFSSILKSHYLTIGNENSNVVADINNATNQENIENNENRTKVYIEQTAKAGITINSSGDKPYISLVIPIKVKILDNGKDSNIEGNISKLKDRITTALKNNIKAYLNKVQKVYNCDIDSFGKYFRGSFATTYNFEDYDWLKKYKDAKIDYVFSIDFIDY